MSAKNMDHHNRFRSKTICFKVSPEENELLDTTISLLGITKQDYLVARILDSPLKIQGNCKIHRNVSKALNEVFLQLKNLHPNQEIDIALLEKIERITNMVEDLYLQNNY